MKELNKINTMEISKLQVIKYTLSVATVSGKLTDFGINLTEIGKPLLQLFRGREE